MNTPVLIRGGKAYPITAAQVELGRRGQPMGPIAGLDAPVRPPVAAAPTVLDTPPVPQPTKPDGRALSRASMLKQIGAQYGAEARAVAAAKPDRRSGVDPKAATIGTSPPAARARASTGREKGPDGLTMGQRSMLKVVEMHHGKAARAQAEARLGIRAA